MQYNKTRYDDFDNLIYKIFKFTNAYDRKSIKHIISSTRNVDLATSLSKISNIILKYSSTLKRDEHRQDFIANKLISYITKANPDLLHKDMMVTDIGGGNGDVISNICEYVKGEPSHFMCVETENEWVESYSHTNTNISYTFWNNKHLDIPDASCDIVLCMVSLHHMTHETIQNALSEIHRILKKDGLLFIKEHNNDSQYTEQIIEWEHHLYHILDCAYNNTAVNPDEYLHKSIHNFQSKTQWNAFLHEAQFDLIDTTNRFLDGPLQKDAKNPTNLYWCTYQKK